MRRFVHLGALGVADEPDLHYASSKAKAMALVRASGLDWTILSPSLLFGPRDGFFNILAGLVRMSPGVTPITGRGAARFQPLAIDDLARVAVRVLADPATAGVEYLLGGPRTGPTARSWRRSSGPWASAAPAADAGPGHPPRRRHDAELGSGPFPVATDQLRQLKFDNTGPAEAVHDAFGFEPRPMEGGLDHLRLRLRDQEPAEASGPLRARRPQTRPPARPGRRQRIAAAVVWLVVAALVALGAAGIVAAMDHVPGTAGAGRHDVGVRPGRRRRRSTSRPNSSRT